MKIKNAMIDLETLATNPNAVVLTIGAVKFNPFTDEITDKLHLKLDVDSQVEKGRTVCDDTLAWWGRQDKEVRETAFTTNRIDVSKALNSLNEWSKDTIRVWCQGPSFDFPILDSLYKQYDINKPWDWWFQRDARTVTSLVNEDLKEKIQFNAHDAVEDCIKQAKCVQYVFKKLNINHTF